MFTKPTGAAPSCSYPYPNSSYSVVSPCSYSSYYSSPCSYSYSLLLALLLLLLDRSHSAGRWGGRRRPGKNLNPIDWWKEEAEYTLLTLFMKANEAMQPTSLAFELLFNKYKFLYVFNKTASISTLASLFPYCIRNRLFAGTHPREFNRICIH